MMMDVYEELSIPTPGCVHEVQDCITLPTPSTQPPPQVDIPENPVCTSTPKKEGFSFNSSSDETLVKVLDNMELGELMK